MNEHFLGFFFIGNLTNFHIRLHFLSFFHMMSNKIMQATHPLYCCSDSIYELKRSLATCCWNTHETKDTRMTYQG